MKKKSISTRLITGYLISGALLLCLILLILKSNSTIMTQLNIIKEYDSFYKYPVDSYLYYANARVHTRTMLSSIFYEESVYNNAISQMQNTTDTLSAFKVKAEKHKLTALNSHIEASITGISEYTRLIKENHTNNQLKLNLQSSWSSQGVTIVNELSNMAEYINSYTNLINGSEVQEYLNAINNKQRMDDIRARFTTVRINSREMMFINETSKYSNILDDIDEIITRLSNYASVAIPEVLAEIPTLIENINNYKESTVQYYGLIEKTNSIYESLVPVMTNLQTKMGEISDETSNLMETQILYAIERLNVAKLIMILESVSFGTLIAIYAIIMIRSISVSLKKVSQSLHQATVNINSSASQLNSAATSLAESGSQQAASIEETSATMNQTAAMVKQNTDNTRHATELAQSAGEIAVEAVRYAEELIKGMDELNQSSDEINKIVSTITNISAQTNILALNASVEAVRAGEVGKSFSVVAEEVRNLSQRSSQAAVSTEGIVRNNINLTKQNVENSKLVSKTLEEICESAKMVTQLLSEIFSASDEQTRGVQQINIALSQMEKSTQANAAVSEESAAAANELKNQADNFVEISDIVDALVYGKKE